jgi:large subunit ribosomal protein L19e
LASKGNLYKNKTVLIEAIHKMKQEKIREKQLAEQREARRAKNAIKKEKRITKKLEAMGQGPKKAADKDVAAAPKDEAPKDAGKKSPAKKEKAKGESKPAAKEQKQEAPKE